MSRHLASLSCFLCAVSLIPITVAAAPKGTTAGASGLVAIYTQGQQKITTIAPEPNFSLKEQESIDPHLQADFKAHYTGFLNVIKQGKYALKLDGAGDAAKLSIDGKPVTDAPVALDIGQHAIEIDFTRPAGPARLQFIWASDDFLPEPVPQSALSHQETPPGLPAMEAVEQGRLLVESLNCVACHHTQSKGVAGRRGPDLTTVGTRLQPAWIGKWLENPQAFRHNTMMPRVPLAVTDRADIVAYLKSLKNPQNKIKEETAKPSSHIASGKQLYESIGCTVCHTSLETNKQDPQKISLTGLGSKWLTGQLAAYLENPLAVDHSGRMPSMLLSREEARDLAEYLTESHDKAFEPTPPTSAPADLVEHGKALVTSAGCVQCHVIESPPGKPLAVRNHDDYLPLEKLTDGKGCLADQPAGKAMDYHLSPPQRKLIVAFIDSIRTKPLLAAAPIDEFRHKVATFGCTRCHELDGFKPAQESERIPMLTDIGSRMRKEWINQVLTQRKRVRPWLHRRMPEFGGENVGNLAELAVAVSGAGEAQPLPTPTRDQIIAGQTLLGTGPGGFACVTCHGFAGAKPSVADDTRGPDLTTVAARLRVDHFQRWVYDPKRVNPATPMPTFFEGVPAAQAMAKIQTMLDYCSLGSNMPPPVGWADEHSYILAVRDKPLINRAFMPNLNGGPELPRGIAVGMPGLISYCFDADTCMVKYAWSGGFLDMKGSWSGRGGQKVAVMGKKFWGSDRFPFKSIDGSEMPQPQFEGYALLNDGMPEFHYRIGEAQIKESIAPTPKGTGIIRRFEIEPHGQPLTFTQLADPATIITGLPPAVDLPTDARSKAPLPGHVKKLDANMPTKLTVTIAAKEEK